MFLPALRPRTSQLWIPHGPQSVPIRPQRRSNLGLGLLFGVFLGFASAYVADSFDRTVSDPLEVEEITGRPVIGVIPTFGKTGRTYGPRIAYEALRLNEKTSEEAPASGSVWMLDHPQSAAAEAFRALRTSILLSRAGGGPKTVLVTSCSPGEGKTTVTTNLAVAFAQHNKRVIILDADMRRPRVKHDMSVPNEVGLSSVLSGSCKIDEAIHRGVYLSTLDVLPSGPHPPFPAEILGSQEFEALLEQLRSRYEVVLIDSPPALLVTDAVSISLKTDAVVWVAQSGAVTRPYLDRATRLIERNGIPVIGFVVNRLSKGIAGYGYEYKYSYYGEDSPNDA